MLARDTQRIVEAPRSGHHRAPAAKSSGAIIPGKGEVNLVLPPADVRRWSSRRKAAVVVAIRAGTITRDEACQRYTLSDEELADWDAAFDKYGIPGLRITRQYANRAAPFRMR